MIPRLYVQETLAQGARFAADPRAAHYLLNVLRRGEGDALHLFNGRDGEFEARIAEAGKRRLVLEVRGRRRAQDSGGDLWLCFAPLKKDAVDFLVEKGTELGVDRFLPVLTAHTTNRSINQTRLTAVATEAAEQCGRLTVPEIAEPMTLEAMRTSWPNGRRLLVCAEAGLASPIAAALQALTADVSISNSYAILCGPEGGFQQDELDRLRKLDFVTPVGLGPRVLRAETAALAALAAFQAILGDGAKRPPQPDRRPATAHGIGAALLEIFWERRLSAPPKSQGEPITSRAQLVEYFSSGSKPKPDWRIGTEHEKFVFDAKSLLPVPYAGPNGIAAIFEGLTRFGWERIEENGKVIALTMDGCNISLEPGGQFELSGAPLNSIHQTCSEVGKHLAQVKEVGGALGIGFLGMGFQPKWSRNETQWMPRKRYEIMRDYMPKRGNLGIDMMTRTCTVQVNLDFASEADMVKKLRVSLALQPIATALFADSPFTEGKPNGFMSYRANIWTDTDPDRTGPLPFAFEDGMGFERYADYLLDVPMYFVYRNGQYIDASGQSFRDFLKGKLPALPGETPTTADWSDHATTAFPEVRVKKFLEMRGADGGPWDRLCALPALFVGLLYDQTALDAAWDLCKGWTAEDRAALKSVVPKQALKGKFRDGTVRDVALEVLKIAREGLKNRGAKDLAGVDESGFLNVLQTIADSGRAPAEEKLDLYNGRWNRSVDPVFREFAY